MVGPVPRQLHELTAEKGISQPDTGLNCQLPPAQLPGWTPGTHLHPGAKELLWEAELSLPSSTGLLHECHKVVGSRKWHQKPLPHFTQETVPRPMPYTAAGDLGEQKGTLSPFSTPPFFYFFTYCNVGKEIYKLYTPDKAFSPVIYLGSLFKRNQPAGSTSLSPANWTIQIQTILLHIYCQVRSQNSSVSLQCFFSINYCQKF